MGGSTCAGIALLQLAQDLLGFAALLFAQGGQVAEDLQVGAEMDPHRFHRALQLAQPRDAQVAGLDRDHQQLAGHHGVDQQVAGGGRGVDNNEGELVLDGGQGVRQAGLVGHQGGQDAGRLDHGLALAGDEEQVGVVLAAAQQALDGGRGRLGQQRRQRIGRLGVLLAKAHRQQGMRLGIHIHQQHPPRRPGPVGQAQRQARRQVDRRGGFAYPTFFIGNRDCDCHTPLRVNRSEVSGQKSEVRNSQKLLTGYCRTFGMHLRFVLTSELHYEKG